MQRRFILCHTGCLLIGDQWQIVLTNATMQIVLTNATMLHSVPHRFNQDVTFEVAMSFSSHILAVVPAAIIGIISGLAAIIFTLLNLRVSP